MKRLFTTRMALVGLALLGSSLIGPLVVALLFDSPGADRAAATGWTAQAPTVVATAQTDTPSPVPPTATRVATETATVAPTLRSSDTANPSATPSPTTTATPLPQPEGMVLIPAGYFQMGASGDRHSEIPEHPVLLDGFYLDRFEVSNAQYGACVEAGACRRARLSGSDTRATYRDDPTFADYPVIGVTWDDASTYCEWAGKRLPSEAEWEYAAGGPENNTWPWSNAWDPARSAAAARDTQPVDAYPEGVSSFGVFQMAGNVAEWVADVYRVTFYAESPPRNPLAEGIGYYRIYRGGSFASPNSDNYTTSRRYFHARTYFDVDIGFRCARSVPADAGESAQADEALIAAFCQAYAAFRPDVACP